MNWFSRFLDFISPRLCVVCGRRLSPTERSLCSVCQLHLPRTAFQFSPQDNPMAQLFWHLAPIERAAAFIYYQPHSEMARMVYQLKYRNSPDVGEDLGRLMATDFLLAHYFDDIDLLLPVPLTRKRQHQRGYNQSEMLSPGHLSRHERQENVDGIFVVTDTEILKGRHVLLIDDICTTGATLTACAKALASIEGIRISVLTLGFTKN